MVITFYRGAGQPSVEVKFPNPGEITPMLIERFLPFYYRELNLARMKLHNEALRKAGRPVAEEQFVPPVKGSEADVA